MENFLKTMIGRKIDIFCGSNSSLRGEAVKVEDGVLHLKDDETDVCYVAIEKIIAVWVKHEKERQPGFVFKS
jgi:hypothetical protein